MVWLRSDKFGIGNTKLFDCYYRLGHARLPMSLLINMIVNREKIGKTAQIIGEVELLST